MTSLPPSPTLSKYHHTTLSKYHQSCTSRFFHIDSLYSLYNRISDSQCWALLFTMVGTFVFTTSEQLSAQLFHVGNGAGKKQEHTDLFLYGAKYKETRIFQEISFVEKCLLQRPFPWLLLDVFEGNYAHSRCRFNSRFV